MTGGVYTITAPSGHQYVGSTSSFSFRWRCHKWKLRAGSHPNKALSSAFKKYGEAGLIFRQLIVCETGMLTTYEQAAIDMLRPKYNARLTAASNRGMRHSAETRAAMSAARKGQTFDAEARARMSAGSKGKQRSDAQKAVLLRNQALARSPEAIAKRLASMRSLYQDPEYLAAMSARQREYMAKAPPTKDWRDRVSAGTRAGIATAKAQRSVEAANGR